MQKTVGIRIDTGKRDTLDRLLYRAPEFDPPGAVQSSPSLDHRSVEPRFVVLL